MVIVNEKAMLPPPPPYVRLAESSLPPPPFANLGYPTATIQSLPPPVLLRIVYDTFHQGKVKDQRKILYWLTMNLRLVNRAFYTGEFDVCVLLCSLDSSIRSAISPLVSVSLAPFL